MDTETRNEINATIDRLNEAGETDAAAKLALAREFFDNPEFRSWTENRTWEATN